MHELGIATSILDTVEKEAEKHPQAQFTVIGLRIGEVAGVDIDSLTFGWDVLTKDTKWDALKLSVELLPRRNRCHACGEEFAVPDYLHLECPKCGAFPTFNVSGDELEIAYMEYEEVTA
jgi:hydrogenase nickel incorporation protein HypA/HybF